MLKKSFIHQQFSVHYLEYLEMNSSSKALLFLHGFPDNPYAWRNQFQYFIESNKGYSIIAPFAPGTLVKQKIPDIDFLANCYIELIKLYQFNEITVIAHDLGGPLAARIAQLAEHMNLEIRKIIMINAPSLEQMFFRKSQLRQLKKSWYIFLFQIPKIPEILLERNWKRLQQRALKLNNIDDEENYHDINVLNAIELYRIFFKEVPKLIHTKPKKIAVPFDFIWSKNDPYLESPSKMELENNFENYSLEIIDTYHWPQLEQPKLINKLLERRL